MYNYNGEMLYSKKIENYLKRLKRISCISAAIMILTGIFFCMKPYSAAEIISMIAGVLLFFSGMAHIYSYFRDHVFTIFFYKSGLILGVLNCILGLFLIVNPHVSVSVFIVIFSLYIMITSVYHIENALLMKRWNIQGWASIIVLSVIMIAASLILICNLQLGIRIAFTWIGIILIADGISGLITLYHIKKIGKQFYNHVMATVNELEGNIIDADEVKEK